MERRAEIIDDNKQCQVMCLRSCLHYYEVMLKRTGEISKKICATHKSGHEMKRKKNDVSYSFLLPGEQD